MGLKLRQGKLFTRSLPVLVWLGAIAVVAFLFVFQTETIMLKGIVFSFEQTINSVETGYIRSIPVKLYQEVRKGDTLAVIKENTVAREEYNSTLLSAQKATAEAELIQLRAELEAAEDKLLVDNSDRDNDITTMERRFAIDLEGARINVLQIRASLEPDRLFLKDIEVEMDIVKSLLKEGAAEEYELQKAQASYAILKEKITQTEQLLTQAQKIYVGAQLRKDEFEQKVPMRPILADKELAPIRKAILVQERRIEELVTQRDIIVLTAPFDGIINSLDGMAGQTVVRGDEIMTIIKPAPDVITAWVRQKDMRRFTLNTKVKVVSLNAPRHSFMSQVSNVSSSLERIPERLWTHPKMPEWGRSVQIPIQPTFACIHNEVVGIKAISK
jgi:multidrug resistance efflux pump